ncbi:MAG: DMT family transporter [Planctomycetota bacterium]|nr:DMT family transporter [Planctomycetota bacterium]
MRQRALLFAAVANLLGGLSYLWQKLALAGLPPLTVAAGRNLIGIVLLFFWAKKRNSVQWVYPRQDALRLFIVGTCAYAIPLTLGIVGLQWSTASNASILILLEPAAILVFARILLGEQLRPRHIVGVACGLFGAMFIVTEDADLSVVLQSEHFKGNAILFAHGILWGLYSPLIRDLSRKYDPVSLTLSVMTIAMLVLGPAALTERHRWLDHPDQLSQALIYTAVLGVAVSFASTVLWTLALRNIQANTMATFVFLQPLAGVASGALLLNEHLTSRAIVGSVLIAVGILAVTLNRSKKEPEPPL